MACGLRSASRPHRHPPIEQFRCTVASTHRANELWMVFTNSKLPTASPRKAGVKLAVKRLKCSRLSPSSSSATLLTMFSKATLAQALFTVYAPSVGRLISMCFVDNILGLQTRYPQDSSVPACPYLALAICIGISDRRWADYVEI